VLRHEFRPGRLVAGLSLTAAGVAYAGDAGGLWDMPWFALIPMVVGGLCLAAAVGMIGHGAHSCRSGHGTDRGSGTEADPAGPA
jgi:hypothetical protein